MNSPQPNPKTPKATDLSRPTDSPALVMDGLGLPHLSPDAARRANDSGLEPDESVDLDETIRKDKEVADENASSSPGT